MSALGLNLTEPPLEERRCDSRRTQGRRRLYCRWPGGELTLETRDALGRSAGPTRFNTTSRDPNAGQSDSVSCPRILHHTRAWGNIWANELTRYLHAPARSA